jgi:hypothetical protein
MVCFCTEDFMAGHESAPRSTDDADAASAPSESQRLLTARILWLAMTMSHLLLGAAFVLVRLLPWQQERGADQAQLAPAALLAAFADAVTHDLSVVGALGVALLLACAALNVPLRLFEGRSLEASDDEPRSEAASRLTRWVVQLALSEAVTLVGFVLGFALSPDPRLFFPFVLAGVLLTLSAFPRDLALGARGIARSRS